MPSPMVFSADLDFSKGDKSAMTAWDRIQGRLDRKPLQVKFDDHMSAPLGRITGNVGEFDSALNAATKRVVSFGAAMIIINQFKNAFGELVKSTVDVEYSLAKINTNINTTKEGLKDFGSKLFDIAKNTGNSFNETAKAAEVLTRQGLSLQESLKRTSDALIMNRLSGISVTDAIKTLTETTNSFNKESLTSADILNRMTVASKNYAVSAHDLEEAVSRAGVTASEAGVSFNQLIALVTTAQQATQRGGNIIGNDLNTIFTNTRESKVIDNLRGLGIAVKDTSGHLLPAIDILRNLSKAYYGLSESNKSAVSQEIAGKRQSDVLLAMLRDLSKEYGVYGNVLNSVSHATNEAYRQNEQLNSTLKGTLAQTSALSTQVFSKVGESGVGPVMKGVVGSINSVLSAGYGDKATDTGKYIGESIVKGISAVLTGPVLIGALKLGYQLVTTFGTQIMGMIKSFGASNTIAEQRAGIQQKINVLDRRAHV